jgi:response regulator RpfG family c-di-GMP phosphodiesterase
LGRSCTARPGAGVTSRPPGPLARTGPTRRPALIVNDDPEQLAALTAYFHHAGCTVIGVADAERALALAPDVQPDVIVFDPGTHGQEQTARLGLRYPHCLTVVTTVLDVHHHDRGRPGGSSPTVHPAAAS